MLKILFFTSALFLFITQSKANQPPCEVWNYDTESCETFAEQNLSINSGWTEIIAQDREWTKEELKAYLDNLKD